MKKNVLRTLVVLMLSSYIFNSADAADASKASVGPSIDETASAIRDIYLSCPAAIRLIEAVKFRQKDTFTHADAIFFDETITLTDSDIIDATVNDELRCTRDVTYSSELGIANLDLSSYNYTEEHKEFFDTDGSYVLRPSKVTIKCVDAQPCITNKIIMNHITQHTDHKCSADIPNIEHATDISIMICDKTHSDRMKKALTHLQDLLPKRKASAF